MEERGERGSGGVDEWTMVSSCHDEGVWITVVDWIRGWLLGSNLCSPSSSGGSN